MAGVSACHLLYGGNLLPDFRYFSGATSFRHCKALSVRG